MAKNFFPKTDELKSDSAWEYYFSFVDKFESAYYTAKSHPNWKDESLIHSPLVSFDPVHDDYFFIFVFHVENKGDNEMTFIVSRNEFPIPQSWELDQGS